MSSSFPNSVDQFAEESLDNGSNSFDNSYLGPYAFYAADHTPPIDVSYLSDFPSRRNSDQPILPPLEEMEPEEGYALREWRRQNAIRLEEKEKTEKDLLSKIITEADEQKVKFNTEWLANRETNRAANREKETVFVASQEKFYAEADKDYWKSISELIPKEVPTIETRKSKKDQKNKTSTSAVVVQGPKPGKQTDLARMRQILIKLKHGTPSHLKPSPPSAADAKTEFPSVTSSSESVAVA